MVKLYVLDLEGTTGIYNEGETPHTNNTLQLRPGFRETIVQWNEQRVPYALATRAPADFTSEIIRNLRHRGVLWEGGVFTREQVQFPDERLLPYKDLSQIIDEYAISSPADEIVMIGDFLRFNGTSPGYHMEEYLRYDFREHPECLTENFALNDHPFPDGNDTPTYVVVPQPWTTRDTEGKRVSLDFCYVISVLQKIFALGAGSFARGFELLQDAPNTPSQCPEQFVRSAALAQRLLKKEHAQRYFIMKGTADHWRPLEVLV